MGLNAIFILHPRLQISQMGKIATPRRQDLISALRKV